MLGLILVVTYAGIATIAAVLVFRRPIVGLWLLLGLLPIHTLLMVLIYHYAGLDKGTLSVFQVWKDLLLMWTLVAALLKRAALRNIYVYPIDLIVLVIGLIALASIPLHPSNDVTAEVLALRNDFWFVPAYFIGRFLVISRDELRTTFTLTAVVGFILVAAAVIEYFVSPAPLLVAIDLPGYWSTNFHITFLSTEGLPYNYFTGLGTRRMGSLYLSSVDFAEFGTLALASAFGLIRLSGNVVRIATVCAMGGVFAPLLALGRAQLLITPILLLFGSLCVPYLRRLVGPVAIWAAGSLAAILAIGVLAVGVLPLPSALNFSDSSAASHLQSLSLAANAFASNLVVGEGLGSSGLIAARIGTGGGEGQLLVMAQDLGDPALVLLAALMLLGIFLTLDRALKTNAAAAAAATAGGICLLGVFLSLPFAEVLANTQLSLATFVLLGQAVGSRRIGSESYSM